MKAYSDVMDFWNSGGGHTPKDYLDSYTMSRSQRLVEFMYKLGVDKNAKILEIGCNCGRNLSYLYNAGYKNLTGIDIEGFTFVIMEQVFPDMYNDINKITSPIEEVIPKFKDNEFDVVISMGVLMHIHPDVFDVISSNIHRVTNKYLLTFECEKRDRPSPYCIDRNYKEVFESIGFKEKEKISDTLMYKLFLSKEYFGRIFEK